MPNQLTIASFLSENPIKAFIKNNAMRWYYAGAHA
jgi:hypothetical protein